MILEDDESDTSDPEAIAVFASVDTNIDFAFELSKSINLFRHEVWYNVENNHFVDKNLCSFPLLKQKGLTSMLAQGQSHSCYHFFELSHD